MLSRWNVGRIKVSSIREQFGPTHDPAILFPELDRGLLAHHRPWLVPDHYFPAVDRLVVGIQIWVVHADDRIILVDTGVGNRKNRAIPRSHQLNTLVLSWLDAAGAPRDRVTDVVATHLHSDHVGWNTTLVDGCWEPTFPNATHWIPKADFDFFKREVDAGRNIDLGSLADSVLPVVEAGLARFIENDSQIAGMLRVAEAPGHTPGQLNYWIESDGQQGVFSADIMHHPLQIVDPDLNTAFCVLPDAARKTRAEFLARAADARALVMPCHFGPPHCGYVRRDGNGFRFEPAFSARLSTSEQDGKF